MANDQRLSPEAASLIIDPQNMILVSSVSFWEIAVKKRLDKIEISLPELLEAVRACDFETLSVRPEHCIQLADLPLLHRDPFDRMLVAQSRVEPAILVTSDRTLSDYGETVMLV